MSLLFLVLAIIFVAAAVALPMGSDRDAAEVAAVGCAMVSSFLRERNP